MAYIYNAALCAGVHFVNFGFPKPQVGSSNLPRVTIQSITYSGTNILGEPNYF
jgi:hypothetical protein